MKPNAPIKRTAALMPLSHDHHQGLLLCWKVRQGLRLGVEPVRIGAYIREFFRQDIESHFREEEELVFPLLPAANEYRRKAENQHIELRSLVADEQIMHVPESQMQFADALDAHIRFEERELFGIIEQEAGPEVLEALSVALAGHAHGCEPEWNDAFWKNLKN